MDSHVRWTRACVHTEPSPVRAYRPQGVARCRAGWVDSAKRPRARVPTPEDASGEGALACLMIAQQTRTTASQPGPRLRRPLARSTRPYAAVMVTSSLDDLEPVSVAIERLEHRGDTQPGQHLTDSDSSRQQPTATPCGLRPRHPLRNRMPVSTR